MPDETKKPPIIGAPREGGEPTGSGDKEPIFPTTRDDGSYDIVIGTSGNDELFGYGGNDTLVGGAGRDVLHGGLGEDLMLGGTDDDTYYVNTALDVVSEAEGEGTDLVVSSATYSLTANVENLILSGTEDLDGYGNKLGNTIVGNGGSNKLYGGTGNDLLKGGGGDDFLYGGNDDDTLLGGAGVDTMTGGFGNDKYYVDDSLEKAIEQANAGYDTVFSSVDYTLGDNIEVLSLAGGTAVSGTGNGESNTIFGNAGDNILDGGANSDSLSGLGGNDTFVFKAGEAHGDIVYEFEGNGLGDGDMLKFVGYGPGATLTQFSADVWIIASADGSIQEAITFIGGPALVGQDCIFV